MSTFSNQKGLNETFVAPSRDSNGNFDFTEVDYQNSRNYVQGNKIVPVRVITPAGTSAQEVKITDGTDKLLINTDGSVNVVQDNFGNKTFYNYYLTGTGANQTVHTVTAGKTAYVYGFGPQNGAATANLLNNAGSTIFSVKAGASVSYVVTSFFPLGVYTAGQNILANVTNTFPYNVILFEK